MPKVKLFLSVDSTRGADAICESLESQLANWLGRELIWKKGVKILNAQTALTASAFSYSGILTVVYEEQAE